MMKHADYDWSGRLLGGRFRVDARAEAGAFLYEGRDDETGAPVSLLILSGGDARAGEASATDLARLSPPVEHESLARVLGAVSLPGEPLVVAFEHLPGESWRALMTREGRQSEQRAATVADGILACLEQAHAARISHGALYPGFVMLQETAAGPTAVRLVGFGLAGSSLASPPLEATAYVAPELARNRRPEVAADLYAVGAMLYHALSGQPPYPTPSRSAALYALLTGPPPPLEGIVPDLAPGLLEVVQRATLRRAQGRFGSAAEMRTALRPWVRSHAGRVSPSAEPVDAPVTANAASLASATRSVQAPTLAPAPAEPDPCHAQTVEGAPGHPPSPETIIAGAQRMPTKSASARWSRRGLIAALLGTGAFLLLAYLLARSPTSAPPIGPPAATSRGVEDFDPARGTSEPTGPPVAPPPSDAGTASPSQTSKAAALADVDADHTGSVAAGLLAGNSRRPDGGRNDGGTARPTGDAGSTMTRTRTATRRRRWRRRRRERRRRAASAPRTARLTVMETRRLYGLARVHRLVLAFSHRVNRCFTLGDLARRDRRPYGWKIRVDARGRVLSVRGLGRARRRARLDRCMRRLLGGIAWGRPETGRSGSLDLYFSSRVSSRR